MNGNERYILEGIIIVLIAAYIFYENVFMAVILSPYVYIHYRQRIKERIVHDKKNFKKKFKDGIIAVSFALNVGYSKIATPEVSIPFSILAKYSTLLGAPNKPTTK